MDSSLTLLTVDYRIVFFTGLRDVLLNAGVCIPICICYDPPQPEKGEVTTNQILAEGKEI